jgi:hypothetical protein
MAKTRVDRISGTINGEGEGEGHRPGNDAAPQGP